MVENKSLYLFELDNVLFPKRDYLVQVYYLFGSFYEFTEGQNSANTIAQFMTKIYDIHGEEEVFPAAKTMFNINEKYEENFNRLMANAQLPLKLEFTKKTEILLTNLINNNKKIAILTKGNPIEQLNKLKFIDWENFTELRSTLKVYFKDELEFRFLDPIDYISKEYNIDKKAIEYIDII